MGSQIYVPAQLGLQQTGLARTASATGQREQLEHLRALENESIYILREVAAEFRRPVLLFSGGKDSICLLRLAEKAFFPGPFQFPLLHVDTGHNFEEVIEFRDSRVAQLGAQLHVASVEEALANGIATVIPGDAGRNRLQTPTLLDALTSGKFDAAIGGARRDEEKARAKERVFSLRDSFGSWNPKRQRPELWHTYNAKIHAGEHMRVFPLSNWTELDVWQYILQEQLAVPSIYFSHRRQVVIKAGQLLAVTELTIPQPSETTYEADVRVRTVGDITCTGFLESDATTVEKIIDEIKGLRTTERGTRGDDRFSETAMEDRKKEGYF
jgi:sulfate adenylyltransferase subunit 2